MEIRRRAAFKLIIAQPDLVELRICCEMKAFKFKLKPNKKFEANCAKTLDICRELYNASLQERRDAYRLNGISINYQAQQNQLPEIKELREDLDDIYSQVLQDVLKRSDKAFKAFFRRCKNGEKPGYPRFRGKDRYDSFTYPQSGFSLKGDKLFLSKIGSCRIRLSRKIEGKIKTCTIKRECDGWYVIFTLAQTPKKTLPKTGKSVGIDLGCESFATLSNGEQIENPRFFKTSEERLAEAQRKLALKTTRSGKREARKKVLAKTHRKIQNQRKDFAHKLSNNLLERFDGIAIEDLNVKGLQQGSYSKSISDVAWATFTAIISYKAAEAGKKVVLVNPAYTSQDCSACGQRRKLEVRDRWYQCSCGLSLHRDHNAAINILVRAEPHLKQWNLPLSRGSV